METLDLNIINKHFPEFLSYKYLLLFYMSSNTFYKDKLSEDDLEIIYYTPRTNDEFKISIKNWCHNRCNLYNKYKNISRWNTMYITDMKNVFQDQVTLG